MVTSGVNGATRIDQFWGDVSPCEHLVQFYEDEGIFMDTLERYVMDGLRGGEAVITIATGSHLGSLAARIQSAGLELADLAASGRYLAFDAATTLSRFMVDGWPDEDRFEQVIAQALAPARRQDRPVRAFGEMVGLLWGQDNHGAAVRLEQLWCGLCERERLALFCAYPRFGSTRDLQESVADICALHTQVHGVAQAAG